MKPYPVDFRQEIVNAYKNKEGSMLQLACKYKVSRSFVQKIIKQEKETGTVAPIAKTKHNSKLHQHTKLLEQIIRENPDFTLKELCQVLEQETGVEVSISTMHKFARNIDKAKTVD